MLYWFHTVVFNHYRMVCTIVMSPVSRWSTQQSSCFITLRGNASSLPKRPNLFSFDVISNINSDDNDSHNASPELKCGSTAEKVKVRTITCYLMVHSTIVLKLVCLFLALQIGGTLTSLQNISKSRPLVSYFLHRPAARVCRTSFHHNCTP